MVSNPQYNKGVDITPSDTVDFPDGLCAAIYVGGAGVVPVVWQDGSISLCTAVAGEILPFRARRVNNTSLGASLLRALYQV